jgi:hypothetical protein
MVDISGSTAVATRQDRGGAGTSIENNNVFTVQVSPECPLHTTETLKTLKR